MSTHAELIDLHLQAYAEPDRAQRAQLVERIWAEGGRLIDPPLQAQGHAAIVAQADALLGQFPRHHFRRSTEVDSHNGHARYGWQLCGPTGQVVLEGLDVAAFDDAGRLQQVVGFFGPMAARAPA